jgi:hypothetical protein
MCELLATWGQEQLMSQDNLAKVQSLKSAQSSKKLRESWPTRLEDLPESFKPIIFELAKEKLPLWYISLPENANRYDDASDERQGWRPPIRISL